MLEERRRLIGGWKALPLDRKFALAYGGLPLGDRERQAVRDRANYFTSSAGYTELLVSSLLSVVVFVASAVVAPDLAGTFAVVGVVLLLIGCAYVVLWARRMLRITAPESKELPTG